MSARFFDKLAKDKRWICIISKHFKNYDHSLDEQIARLRAYDIRVKIREDYSLCKWYKYDDFQPYGAKSDFVQAWEHCGIKNKLASGCPCFMDGKIYRCQNIACGVKLISEGKGDSI